MLAVLTRRCAHLAMCFRRQGAGFLAVNCQLSTVNRQPAEAVTGLVLGAVVIGIVALALTHTALQGIYSAALYKYASEGAVGGPFSNDLLQNAFRRK